MKSILLSILVIAFSTSVYSQYNTRIGKGYMKINWYKDGWFIDGNGGVRLLGKTSDLATMEPGVTANGGIGYFFNESFGLKGRADYHSFTTVTDGVEDPSHSIALSAEAMLRLLQKFGNKKFRKFDIVAHGGIGLTSSWNPEYRRLASEAGIVHKDPFIKGADDLFHLVVGITPQVHLNSRVSLNLDISHFIMLKRYMTYDVLNKIDAKDPIGVTGLTFGLTIRL